MGLAVAPGADRQHQPVEEAVLLAGVEAHLEEVKALVLFIVYALKLLAVLDRRLRHDHDVDLGERGDLIVVEDALELLAMLGIGAGVDAAQGAPAGRPLVEIDLHADALAGRLYEAEAGQQQMDGFAQDRRPLGFARALQKSDDRVLINATLRL